MQKLNPQFKCEMNVVFDTIPSDYWFNQMYYGTHGPFKRAEAGQAITFENDKVCHTQYSTTRSFNLYIFQVVVHGFIESDSYSPLLNISVIPQVTYRLAPAIWKKMYNYDPNWYGGHGSGGASVAPHRTSRVTAVIPVILVMILTSMMTRTRVS